MNWTEVKVVTESEAVEAVSSILMEAGAHGVAIEDALDLENYKGDKFGWLMDKEAIDHVKEGALVMAYYPETVFMPEILPFIKTKIEALPDFGLNIGAYEILLSEIRDEDWATAWKKYYHPVKISRFLTIVPDWEEYTPRFSDERIIVLDPGMAFGTGTHPTTRLSLISLETALRGGETVIDVGTGSGVLSIAAKLLDAQEVYAYDLDDVAVAAAKENMALNPAARDVHVATGDLLKGVTIQADVIVANILADIILLMIDDAYTVLKEGGLLIVSGIIQEKGAEIEAAMTKAGFILIQQIMEGDWLAYTYRKPDKDE